MGFTPTQKRIDATKKALDIAEELYTAIYAFRQKAVWDAIHMYRCGTMFESEDYDMVLAFVDNNKINDALGRLIQSLKENE